MSAPLPPEILDLIIDYLHHEPTALNACCAVSKSWVPRARRHLFFQVIFSSIRSPFKLWMKAFPDPSNSPAYCVRTLVFWDLTPITAAGTYAHDWIHSFCHIIELKLTSSLQESKTQVSLVPLHGLSPALKSLSLHYFSTPPQKLLDFICSFPLLENLRLHLCSANRDTAVDERDAPSSSPKFTGSLRLDGEILPITRGLLDLPNGLHFSRVEITCLVEDADLTTDLVAKCCDTLESLSIYHVPLRHRMPPAIDLSKVTKLKDLEFRCDEPNVLWITSTLRTTKSKNLRRITIRSRITLINTIGGTDRQEWRELDCFLVQLWASHSVRPISKFSKKMGSYDLEEVVLGLLPGLTSRGFVDVVDSQLLLDFLDINLGFESRRECAIC